MERITLGALKIVLFARYNEADESRKMSWRGMQHALRNKNSVQNLGLRT